MQGIPTGQNGSNQGGSKSGGLSWSTPTGSSNTSSNTPASQPMSGSKPMQTSPLVKPGSTPSHTSSSKSPNKNDGTRGRATGLVIGGLIVLALVVWAWSASNSTPSTTSTSTNTGAPIDTTYTGTVGGTNTNGTTASNTGAGTVTTNDIEVGPQAAGMSVVVADATVSVPTWLVVYEVYQGKPFRALGATMFFPEFNGKGGVISLVRATSPNTTYFVGESLDNGDHTFTPHVNKEVTDNNGKMIGVTFTTNK